MSDRLGPILDELVTHIETGQDEAGYFHTHALLLTVLEASAPHVRHAPIEVTATHVERTGCARRVFAVADVPARSTAACTSGSAYAR